MEKIGFGLANGGIPPIEDVFACMTPRISGTEPLPRISCLTGEGEPRPIIKIECLWPRLSCLMGIRKEEEAGRYGQKHNIGRKDTKKQSVPQSKSKVKVQEKRRGFGVNIPVQKKVHQVKAVPVGQPPQQLPPTQAPGNRYIIRP